MKKKQPTRREHQRASLITTLADYVLSVGLSETSLRQLADAGGVSNRMLLYYFEDKSEIIRLVLMQIAAELAQKLGSTLTDDAPQSPRDAFLILAKLAQGKELRPHMMVWVEAAAAASRGQEPFTEIAAAISKSFIVWMEERLSTPDPKERKADAAMILAMVDGLTVLSTCVPASQVRSAQNKMAATLKGDGE
ncbi:MAG: TetR/AcrR family transcriptional regulator [Myxococcota bacterium]